MRQETGSVREEWEREKGERREMEVGRVRRGRERGEKGDGKERGKGRGGGRRWDRGEKEDWKKN